MVLQIHNTTAISDKKHRESIKRMEEVANTIIIMIIMMMITMIGMIMITIGWYDSDLHLLTARPRVRV